MPTREDIARAAYEAHKPRNKEWEALGLWERQQWLASTDAVRALMQPDEAMVEAGTRAISHVGNPERAWDKCSPLAQARYRRMARACLTAAMKQGGAASERAAVVAWLEAQAGEIAGRNDYDAGRIQAYENAAFAIEQGQHTADIDHCGWVSVPEDEEADRALAGQHMEVRNEDG